MDKGTRLRTVLVVAISLNTALMATDVAGFENPTVDFWYKIMSLVLNFVIVAINTYYNNNYTEAGLIGTDVTRRLKEDPELVVVAEDDEDLLEDEEDPDEDEIGDDIITPEEVENGDEVFDDGMA